MEQKRVEKRSLILDPLSQQHWTATLTLVLLVLSLLADLLLGGVTFPHIFSWTGFGTIMDVDVWVLTTFCSVVLCIVSQVASTVARQEQWRRGRKLALWGWVVGTIGVLLILGVFFAWMSIDVSHIGGHCVKHSVSDPCTNAN
jgi:hypothetical protein